jgi:hypothetical protein
MKKKCLFLSASIFMSILFFSSCQKQSVQPNEDNTISALRASGDSRGNESQVNVFKGPELQMGNGKVRSWISISHAGIPQEIGIELEDAALYGLPQDPVDFAAATFSLPLHQKAKEMTAFDHIVVNWNVHGHEPEHVFDVPHFDFHFYMISVAEQTSIPPYPMAPADFDNLPPPSYWPDMYFPTPEGVPGMGKHWIDGFFAPPFSKTLIYGSYKGKFTFVEPMITLATLLSGSSYSIPYRQPHVFVPDQRFYPTVYNIYKDAATGKHYVTLSNFVWR